jgi:hypothetical protein
VFHNTVILLSDHYMVHIVNLYTHVQVNLKLHIEGIKISFFKGIEHTENLLIVFSHVSYASYKEKHSHSVYYIVERKRMCKYYD